MNKRHSPDVRELPFGKFEPKEKPRWVSTSKSRTVFWSPGLAVFCLQIGD